MAVVVLAYRYGLPMIWFWAAVALASVPGSSHQHQYHLTNQHYWQHLEQTVLYATSPAPLLQPQHIPTSYQKEDISTTPSQSLAQPKPVTTASPQPLEQPPQIPSQEDFADLLSGGQTYCSSRWPVQCCPGREDGCTVPILDTVCYCDVFCNRTVTDCCPDFWGHCMGKTPPPGVIGPSDYPGVYPNDISNHLILTTTRRPATTTEPIQNKCMHGNWRAAPWQQIQVNCNNCTCVKVDFEDEFNWQCTQKICVIRSELLDHVNQGEYGWRGTNHSMFWGLSLDEGVCTRLGTTRPMQTVKQMTSLRSHVNDVIPEEFDARLQWPGLIHPVLDQGKCGASWAFSTVSVAADRLSIHSQGRVKDMLSAEQLLACNQDDMQRGCKGGHLDRAWWFLRRVGVVSELCYPYKSGMTSQPSTCQIPRYKMLSGKVKCPSSKHVATSEIYQASPPYRVAPNEREIQKEVMDNGPVQATLEVKEDFFMYKGGVYRHSLPANFLPPNHRKTGFHSVKLIGWGVDYSGHFPLKYWLCANSWGDKWGEDGYFRIVRGTDECMIESFVVSVLGKINGHSVHYRPRSSRKLRDIRTNGTYNDT